MADDPLLKIPAIRITQPLGEFYVVAIPARTLRAITFIDPTRIAAADRSRFLYRLLGAQRVSSVRRAKQIAHYIDTVEAAFPNSIIVAANYVDDGALVDDPAIRWHVHKNGTECYELIVPTERRLASIIDGQHRLLGFDYSSDARKDMQLLCAVYMDLPHAYQAYLFATININQRKVDKSLAYEQFGYNLDDEPSKGWSPDKLGVYLARKLNLDPESPFQDHIKIAPIDADELLPQTATWQVSTAAIVEGVMKLISTSPTRDRDLLHKQLAQFRSRENLSADAAPLRELYKQSKDEALFDLLKMYFERADAILWKSASEWSYVKKTVGIQALFDILRQLAAENKIDEIPATAGEIFEKSSKIDFSDPVFQASGKGRVLVRNTIWLFGGRVELGQLPEQDQQLYSELLAKYS